MSLAREILGVDHDPNSTTTSTIFCCWESIRPSLSGAPGQLVELIKAKKKEWTAQALNPLYQQAARTNLERVREFEPLLAEPDALAAYVSHVKECRVALRDEHEAMLVGLIALASGARRELTVAQRDLLLKEVKGEGLPPSLLDEVLKSRAIAIVAARARARSQSRSSSRSRRRPLMGSSSARFRSG